MVTSKNGQPPQAHCTMNTPHPSRLCLYDTAQLNAVLDKMASQLMAMVNGTSPCAVIGVLRRGAPLANLLLRRMVRVHGLKPPLRLDLAVKRYSDDLTLLYADPLLSEPAPSAPLDLTGHQLLVVDDVLYTGHSMLKVVSHLVQKSHSASESLAWQIAARPPCPFMPMWWGSSWPWPPPTSLSAMSHLMRPV